MPHDSADSDAVDKWYSNSRLDTCLSVQGNLKIWIDRKDTYHLRNANANGKFEERS